MLTYIYKINIDSSFEFVKFYVDFSNIINWIDNEKILGTLNILNISRSIRQFEQKHLYKREMACIVPIFTASSRASFISQP